MPEPSSIHELAAEIGSRLRARGETLALAESCTGGLIAATLSAVPGASDYLWGGAVVYTKDAKTTLTGLDDAFLQRHGTVSKATSEALARAVQERSGASYGLAVTGWAGPAAGEGGAIGTVFGALADAFDTVTERWELQGDREQVRHAAVRAALALLRARLTGKQDGTRPGK